MDTTSPASSELPPGSRLVAYLRDSGGRDQNLSVPQQQAAVVEWCKANGHILTRVFADVARSGTKLAGREQFIEMVQYLEGKPGEAGVVFWEYARLSRDYDDLMYYVADLRRQGYAVISITDRMPEGLEGRLMESIIAWKNARYSEDMRKNIKRGQRYIVTVHKAKPGGRPPYGYRYRNEEIGKRRDGTPHMVNKLEPDPIKAPLVRRAFEMRANGATYWEINEELHLHTWLVRYYNMFHNPIYTGVADYYGMHVEDFCEPIVDKATWYAVQQINEERAEQHGINHPRTIRSRFYLSGLLFCAICGRPMNGRVTHQRKPYTNVYLYYRCMSENAGARCGALVIRKEAIEARVLSAVRMMLTQPQVLQDIYAQLQEDAENGNASYYAALDACRADIATNKGQIARMVAAIRDAGHSPAMINELAAMETRERELAMRLAQLEANPPAVIEMDVESLAADTLHALEIAEDREKGAIVRGFIKRIVAKRNGAVTGEIEFYAPGTEETFVVPL